MYILDSQLCNSHQASWMEPFRFLKVRLGSEYVLYVYVDSGPGISYKGNASRMFVVTIACCIICSHDVICSAGDYDGATGNETFHVNRYFKNYELNFQCL